MGGDSGHMIQTKANGHVRTYGGDDYVEKHLK